MDNLHSIDILGNSSIGIFGISTSSYALVPYGIKPKVLEQITDILNVPVIQTTIANCHLLGLFACGNTNNLLIPDLISDYEYETITSQLPDHVSVHTINSKITALGNSVVTSDDVAVVHAEFSANDIKRLEDALDVEVIQKRLLENPLVGSMVFRNDNGLLAHPLISYEELEWLADYFKVRCDVVTINRGTPYPRPGIVGNKHGVLIGSDSSGPELMRIYEILLS